jgi:anti-sigma factor RsiW
MNDHDDISKLLAAYCGDDLETTERSRVEEHLAVCAACRAELSDLQTALRLIRTTPEVEPPPWLATRIMARIREQQREKRSWLQRLFFPLHVKLPFEVAALLLVCVSGYYMARTVETELQKPISRQETVVAPPQTGTHTDTGKQAAPTTPTPATPAPTPPPANVNRATAPSAPVPAQPLAPKAAEQVAPPQLPEYSKAPPQPQMYGASSRVMKEERAVPAAEPMLENAPSNQALSSERSAKKAKKATPPEAAQHDQTSAETAQGAAIARPELNMPVVKIRMTFANPAEASASLREMIIRSGGSLTDEHSTQPNTLQARLPSPRLQGLLEQLERMGKIIGRPQLPDATGIIKIEISW